MNQLEPELCEFVFTTKERARAFVESMNKQTIHRLQQRATLRKSLPEFKGHKNPNYSVWVLPFSLCDSIGVTTYYKVYKEAYDD
ncbi:MAG: hypothetical protein V3U84_07045 [Thiotrichaceae bacterium]